MSNLATYFGNLRRDKTEVVHFGEKLFLRNASLVTFIEHENYGGHGCLVEANGQHASQLRVSIPSVQDFGFRRVVECNLPS